MRLECFDIRGCCKLTDEWTRRVRVSTENFWACSTKLRWRQLHLRSRTSTWQEESMFPMRYRQILHPPSSSTLQRSKPQFFPLWIRDLLITTVILPIVGNLHKVTLACNARLWTATAVVDRNVFNRLIVTLFNVWHTEQPFMTERFVGNTPAMPLHQVYYDHWFILQEG